MRRFQIIAVGLFAAGTTAFVCCPGTNSVLTKRGIIFTPAELVFDPVYPGSRHQQVLRFSNTSLDDYQIFSFATSCSCSVAECPEKSIRAGESIDVMITYRAPLSSGRQTQSLKLIGRYGDEDWNEVSVPLTSVIHSPFTFEPDALVMDGLSVGEVASRTITIKYAADHSPAGPVAILRNHPLIRSVVDPYQRQELAVIVSVFITPDQAYLNKQIPLMIDTGLPGMPPVEYRVTINAVSGFNPSPSNLNVGTLVEGQSVRKTVSFKSKGRQIALSKAPQDVCVTSLPSDEQTRSFSITIEPSILHRNRLMKDEIISQRAMTASPLFRFPCSP